MSVVGGIRVNLTISRNFRLSPRAAVQRTSWRFAFVPEAAIEPDLRLALAKPRFRWLRSTQSSTRLQFRALPQRALKVRPARSFRRLRNAGPNSAPGVQAPPSPCTSRTRQRALSAIILLVEP